MREREKKKHSMQMHTNTHTHTAYTHEPQLMGIHNFCWLQIDGIHREMMSQKKRGRKQQQMVYCS